MAREQTKEEKSCGNEGVKENSPQPFRDLCSATGIRDLRMQSCFHKIFKGTLGIKKKRKKKTDQGPGDKLHRKEEMTICQILL